MRVGFTCGSHGGPEYVGANDHEFLPDIIFFRRAGEGTDDRWGFDE